MKKFINILIFLFIFALYLITFMMIYDNFRERKLNNQEKYALELFENKIEKKRAGIYTIKCNNIYNLISPYLACFIIYSNGGT